MEGVIDVCERRANAGLPSCVRQSQAEIRFGGGDGLIYISFEVTTGP